MNKRKPTPMHDERDELVTMMTNYKLSYGNELEAKKRRLDELIGSSHWLSVGNYKENLIKDLLRRRLPAQFQVGTGFVMSSGPKGGRLVSKQIDVLVWDAKHPTVFSDGDFAIVSPESLRAAIEVKSTLNHKSLNEAVSNLESLAPFLLQCNDQEAMVRGVFAYEIGDKVAFPETLFKKLRSHVRRTNPKKYYQLSGSFVPALYLAFIGVLGTGFIEHQRWALNESEQDVYVAFNTKHSSGNVDSYGMMELKLLLDLLLGYDKHFSQLSYPGFVGMNQPLKKDFVDGRCYMPFRLSSVSQFFQLSTQENEHWCKRAFVDGPTAQVSPKKRSFQKSKGHKRSAKQDVVVRKAT